MDAGVTVPGDEGVGKRAARGQLKPVGADTQIDKQPLQGENKHQGAEGTKGPDEGGRRERQAEPPAFPLPTFQPSRGLIVYLSH